METISIIVIIVISILSLAIWGYAFKKWGFLIGLSLGWLPASIAFIVLIFLWFILLSLVDSWGINDAIVESAKVTLGIFFFVGIGFGAYGILLWIKSEIIKRKDADTDTKSI